MRLERLLEPVVVMPPANSRDNPSGLLHLLPYSLHDG